MRIIGGTFKGRTIIAPKGTTSRPTTDRTRESLFNILSVRDDFDFEVANVQGKDEINLLSEGPARASGIGIDGYVTHFAGKLILAIFVSEQSEFDITIEFVLETDRFDDKIRKLGLV